MEKDYSGGLEGELDNSDMCLTTEKTSPDMSDEVLELLGKTVISVPIAGAGILGLGYIIDSISQSPTNPIGCVIGGIVAGLTAVSLYVLSRQHPLTSKYNKK